MAEKLVIAKQLESGIMHYLFRGNIDEDFVYQELLKEKHSRYLIDFDGVTMINSCGIREWIQFVEKLGKDVQIVYINCPQVIIQQMNMVEGFLTPNAYVHSFYAPYYSEESDEERKVLLKSSQVTNLKAPEQKDQQGNIMEFDAHEKQYFQFIQLQNRLREAS